MNFNNPDYVEALLERLVLAAEALAQHLVAEAPNRPLQIGDHVVDTENGEDHATVTGIRGNDITVRWDDGTDGATWWPANQFKRTA
jgi:hypothetical protein